MYGELKNLKIINLQHEYNNVKIECENIYGSWKEYIHRKNVIKDHKSWNGKKVIRFTFIIYNRKSSWKITETL